MTATLLDCGHPAQPHATDRETGRTMCYACSDAAERIAFAAADVYTAYDVPYPSATGYHIVTWPGGELARVTSRTIGRGGRGSRMVYLRAVAPDGSPLVWPPFGGLVRGGHTAAREGWQGMMTIRTIAAEGSAGSLRIRPEEREGVLTLTHDRHGDGWHAASLSVWGQRDGYVAHLTLHRGDLRALAAAAGRTADWIDARERGEAGPCLCHAWSHGPMFPCPNVAASDSTYCRTCWTPDDGMQGHEARWHTID